MQQIILKPPKGGFFLVILNDWGANLLPHAEHIQGGNPVILSDRLVSPRCKPVALNAMMPPARL